MTPNPQGSLNLLVTAGNTQTPIDRVRVITNIFTGRTGARIALAAHQRGHRVTLLTSHPDAVASLCEPGTSLQTRWRLFRYRTFGDLHRLMAEQIVGGAFDAIIHAAAVNDYEAAGIFAPTAGTQFDPATVAWRGIGAPLRVVGNGGKIKSDEPELWLRLVRAPKLVDKIRADWGFRGTLVKFKLEAGKSEAELLDVAERSRKHSHADWIVANTLEDAAHWGYLGPFPDGYHKIARRELASALLDAIEASPRPDSPDRTPV